MDFLPWYAAMFILGLVALAGMIAFVRFCERV